MSAFTEALHEMVRKFVDGGSKFEPADVRTQLMHDHPQIIRDHFEHLGNRQLLNEIKSILRAWSEDDHTSNDQMTLPGIALPTAIAIPAENESGYVYRSTSSATFEDLLAAEHVRLKNVERAQARLDQFRESLETLRPYMEHDRLVTVADAIEQMQSQNQV